MATGKELILKLKAKLNKLDTTSNRVVRPEMALLHLNDAYIKLVRAKYAKNGGAQDLTAFQYTQLATEELDYLTVVKQGDDVTITKVDDEYHIEKSDLENYYIHLKSSIKTSKGDTVKWRVPNYKKLDSVETTYEDPFNKSEYSDPVLYQEENKFKIIAEDFEVVDFKVSYLERPETITVDSTVDCPFEDELVDSAVTLILEKWGSPRVQTQPTIDRIVASK